MSCKIICNSAKMKTVSIASILEKKKKKSFSENFGVCVRISSVGSGKQKSTFVPRHSVFSVTASEEAE